MEAKESADGCLLAKPLVALTRWVLATPRLTLAVIAVSVLVCGLFTATSLGFHTSRLHLLNPQSSYNRLWLEYIEEFGDDDDVVIVVKAEQSNDVIDTIDELAARIAAEPDLYENTLHHIDLSALKSKGLHYLSASDLAKAQAFLLHLEPILEGDWSQLNSANLLAALCHQVKASQQKGQAVPKDFERVIHSFETAFREEPQYRSPLPEPVLESQGFDQQQTGYLVTNEGTLGLILLQLAKEDGQFAAGTQGISRLRELIAEVRGTLAPGIEVGLTGLPVMENDEMRASQSTMTVASLISIVGVSLMFWASFGGWRHMILSLIALLVGMAWAFAYATGAVGHLNILSVSFAVILIGLGIDFSIHYLARYLLLRQQNYECTSAILQTARTVGPGIVTGAITTSAAFFVASFTEFTGVAELGNIAGGGIFLCGLAALLVLPAVIVLADRKLNPQQISQPLPVSNYLKPFLRIHQITLLFMIFLTAVCAWGFQHLWYDHNLLHLQPEGLESVIWEKHLLEESDQSVWYALSLADSPEQLLERQQKFQQLASVERTEEIVSLIYPKHDARAEQIHRIRNQVEGLVDEPPVIPVPKPEKMQAWLDMLATVLAEDEHHPELAAKVARLSKEIETLTLFDYYERCANFQQGLAKEIWQRLARLRSSSNPEPPQWDDLPEELVQRFVGKGGKYLLKIYANGDIWNMQDLEMFVHDVRSIDPLATGKPLQTYEASRQMKSCYQQAAVYALIAIFIVLWIDFRSLRDTFLALVPLAFAMIQLFGLLGWCGIPINPANIIVLPLIVGIGVDDGVHLVHDFRQQTRGYTLSNSTANSILLTSLTTMVGFGSLMVADHRGIESLGKVMVLGSLTCWASSFFLLPALFTWLRSHSSDSTAEPEVVTEVAPEATLRQAA